MGTLLDFFKRVDENYYYHCKYCGCVQYFPNIKAFKDNDIEVPDSVKKSWNEEKCFCKRKIGADKILIKTKYPKEYYDQKAKEVDVFYKQHINDLIPKPLSFYIRYDISKPDGKRSIYQWDVIQEQIYKTEYFNRHDCKSRDQIRIAPYIFLCRSSIQEICVNCGERNSDTVGDKEYFFDSFKFKKRGIPMPAQRNYRKCNKCGTKWVDKWWDYDVELQKKQ